MASRSTALLLALAVACGDDPADTEADSGTGMDSAAGDTGPNDSSPIDSAVTDSNVIDSTAGDSTAGDSNAGDPDADGNDAGPPPSVDDYLPIDCESLQSIGRCEGDVLIYCYGGPTTWTPACGGVCTLRPCLRAYRLR